MALAALITVRSPSAHPLLPTTRVRDGSGPAGLVADTEPTRAFSQLIANQGSHEGSSTMTPALDPKLPPSDPRVAGKPGCRTLGRIRYISYSRQGCRSMTLYGYAKVSVREPEE